MKLVDIADFFGRIWRYLLNSCMKRVPLQPITVFYASDLPNMATHCSQEECGFSLYRAVLVQWDEDEDSRVLKFIDNLPDNIRNELLVIQEHEAGLGLLWKTHVPVGYEEGREFEIDGDIWHTNSSIAPEI
jgi:hypothetical protein